MRALVFVLAFASCQRETAVIGPAPESAGSSAAVPSAVKESGAKDVATPTNLSPCKHVRPFEGRLNPPDLVLPAPYAAFSPCDILRAIFPDYDETTGRSAAAGGSLAIDETSLWPIAGREPLAVLYYSGNEAEMDMVYGQSRVSVHVAVVEKQLGKLTKLGHPKDPWRPKENPDEVLALFNGRAKFASTAYSMVAGERLLAIETPWSMGMSGHWAMVTLYRLSGNSVDQVFEHELHTTAKGPGLSDDDIVRSEITFEAKEGGPSEVRVVNTEAICTTDFDKPGEPVTCKKAVVVGREKWRFDGTEYKRVEGKGPPVPRVLRSR